MVDYSSIFEEKLNLIKLYSVLWKNYNKYTWLNPYVTCYKLELYFNIIEYQFSLHDWIQTFFSGSYSFLKGITNKVPTQTDSPLHIGIDSGVKFLMSVTDWHLLSSRKKTFKD